jgi:hypothetical protein
MLKTPSSTHPGTCWSHHTTTPNMIWSLAYEVVPLAGVLWRSWHDMLPASALRARDSQGMTKITSHEAMRMRYAFRLHVVSDASASRKQNRSTNESEPVDTPSRANPNS